MILLVVGCISHFLLHAPSAFSRSMLLFLLLCCKCVYSVARCMALKHTLMLLFIQYFYRSSQRTFSNTLCLRFTLARQQTHTHTHMWSTFFSIVWTSQRHYMMPHHIFLSVSFAIYPKLTVWKILLTYCKPCE